MHLTQLLSELGYRESRFFRESGDRDDLTIVHVLRDAHKANVKGTYFIRRLPGDAEARRDRPAVHVAEASTPEEARKIHRHLWNQGITPFLVVSLPTQVRVYTPFAYDDSDDRVGHLDTVSDDLGLAHIGERLKFLRADSIDSGDIWRAKGAVLKKDGRVDRVLLNSLRKLSHQLVKQHGLPQDIAHALVGRFVYLHYLRERDILSDKWLEGIGLESASIFSPAIRLSDFRKLTDAVDARFSGRIFPIDWRGANAPSASAVKATARAFAGEDVESTQIPLFRPFDFAYIPIELLSAIYEQFLHDEGQAEHHGAFYTSEPVADYLLAQLETYRPLELGMKVLDPCCGSGIFLVLAYRRLIEQELHRQHADHLTPSELRQILIDSIFGVERNEEACLVTEFSLILTLLSYIDPPELHRHTNFRFPSLRDKQIFNVDFFDGDSTFWQSGLRFDWIVGNPPWVELDPKDNSEQVAIAWISERSRMMSAPVARFRTSEAFTWRVTDLLAEEGLAGLIVQATSLTNDQSFQYRKAFFGRIAVHHITNFSNLAYVLFESAEEPAATLIFSIRSRVEKKHIVHFGPLVVNQAAIVPVGTRQRASPWVITICESEVQLIDREEAARGQATTWKRALWGNSRDHRALARLRSVLPTTLDAIARERKWALNLGLQLRADEGTKENANQSLTEIIRSQEPEARGLGRSIEALRVVEPGQFAKTTTRLTVAPEWLVKNTWGTHVRVRGGYEGLKIVRAPHLLIWNEFSAYSDEDFLFRHPRIGLAAPRDDADWLKAVSVICTSSISAYVLFLDLSAGWGISRSTIDLGDARQMPMPKLTADVVRRLSRLHGALAAQERQHISRTEWQRRLDMDVASILEIPSRLMSLAREFRQYRLPLIKGKAPKDLTRAPQEEQLRRYGESLKCELDEFLARKRRHHNVRIVSSAQGIVATIELRAINQRAEVQVMDLEASEARSVQDILKMAEQRYGQWVYVRRSVRVFAGSKIHICKPSRRLEWTETQALLDASDIVAEVAESRGLA